MGVSGRRRIVRFQQLKKNSNSILRKKMYKSGKSWVVKSTLSFMCGLVLFGVSQSTVVKADDTAGAVSQATAEVNNTQGQNSTGTVAKTGADVEGDTDKSGNDNTGIQAQTADSIPQQSQIATKAVVQNQQQAIGGSRENDANQPEQLNGSTLQGSDTSVKSSAEVNTVTEPGVSGSDSDDTESKIAALGTDWNITDKNTLHILAGTLNNTTYDRSKSDEQSNGRPDDQPNVQSEWVGLDKDQQDKITNITIDGKVTAQQSIAGLFSDFKSLEKIDGLNNIDVTTVTDFSSLFVNDPKLASIDISNWNWINGMNFSSMFAAGTSGTYVPDPEYPDDPKKETNDGRNDALKTILLPKAIINSSAVSSDDRENMNFDGMFQNNGNLNQIDISHLDMTGAGNVASIFSDSQRISKITLWSKNNLDNQLGVKYVLLADGKKPNGWQSSYKNGLIFPVDDISESMPRLYNGIENKDLDGLTWFCTYANPINFDVEYVAKDDESKVLAIANDVQGYVGTDFTPETLDNAPSQYENYKVESSTNNYYTGGVPNTVRVTDDTTVIKVPVPIKKDPTFEIVAKNTKGNVVEDLKNYSDVSNLTGTFEGNKMISPSSDGEDVMGYVDKVDANGNLDPTLPQHLMSFDKDEIDELINMGEGALTQDSVKDADSLVPFLVDAIKGIGDESGSNYIITLIYDVPDKTTDPGSGTTTGGNTSSGNSSSSSHHSSSNNSTDNSTDTPDVSHSVESVKETIGTDGDISDVQLYDDNGNPVTDRTLAPSSDWYTDNLMTLDGVEYYRVATDLWAKAENVYVYHPISSKVMVNKGIFAKLVTSQGKPVTDRELKPNSGWYTDRYTYINNAKYYRVATNEFVSADDVEEC